MRTAESVTRCHPDKVCDQISDAILDACLAQDKNSRVAVETMGGHGKVYLVGEITTEAEVPFREVAQNVLAILDYPPCDIEVNISRQSPEIASKVDTGGAGDQGVMIGYACNETESLMPLEFVYARALTDVMGNRDGKSQVTILDDGSLDIVTSVCGADDRTWKELQSVIHAFSHPVTRWLKQPGGDWTLGGFDADTGLTGRKIVADAYGPRVPVGGGAFSGKDPSKVDRSGAYMARRIAVDYLRKRGAGEVQVRLAYAIGLAEPLEASVCLDGAWERVTGYDLSPGAIREFLGLSKPIYERTARMGHFGRGYSWDG